MNIKNHLLNLQGLEFIYEKALFPELEYIFKHALVQEVAYNSLLQKRRKDIHEKIGTTIESLYTDRLDEYYEVLAHHFSKSNNAEKAFNYLKLATKKTERRYAVDESKIYFDKAMMVLDSLPETKINNQNRVSFILDHEQLFTNLLKQMDYYDLLLKHEEITKLLGNQSLLGTFYSKLGDMEYVFGSFDRAIETLKAAEKYCIDSENFEELAYVYVDLGWCYASKGDYNKALTMSQHALQMTNKKFNLHYHVTAYLLASESYMFKGNFDLALTKTQTALKIAEDYSDYNLIARSYMQMSIIFALKCDTQRAVEYGERAVQVAPTAGIKLRCQYGLAFALCWSESPESGIETMESVLKIMRNSNSRHSECWTLVILADAYIRIRELEKAEQRASEALELAENYGKRLAAGYSHRILGELNIEKRPEEAIDHFEKSISICTEVGAENELAFAYAEYGRYYKQQGNREKAEEYLTKSLEIFERLGTLIQPDKVKKELAEL